MNVSVTFEAGGVVVEAAAPGEVVSPAGVLVVVVGAGEQAARLKARTSAAPAYHCFFIGFSFVVVNRKKVVANVVFGNENSEPMLGVTVLESAGLMVDPVHRELRKLEAIPLK
jgi:L-2-hydroxyglutarate oxidase LhgO